MIGCVHVQIKIYFKQLAPVMVEAGKSKIRGGEVGGLETQEKGVVHVHRRPSGQPRGARAADEVCRPFAAEFPLAQQSSAFWSI